MLALEYLLLVERLLRTSEGRAALAQLVDVPEVEWM